MISYLPWLSSILPQYLQRGDQPAELCQPGIHLQPPGDPRDQEVERGAGKDSSDWILPDLVGSQQPGVELWRVDQSESLTTDFSQNSCIVFVQL